MDRLALLPREGPAIDDDFEPPKTPMEISIAEIWQEALELKRVGRHDNFFDLGGHSLMAMKVNAKLQRRTGVRFNVGILVTQNLGQVAAIYEAVQRRNQAAQPKAAVARAGGGLTDHMFSAFRRLIGPKPNGSVCFTRHPSARFLWPPGAAPVGCHHPPRDGSARELAAILCNPLA